MLKTLNVKGGFTLVEILISSFIVAVSAVGIIQLYLHCSKFSELSGNVSIAMREAQDKLEEIRDYSYDSIVNAYSSGGSPGDIFFLSAVNGTGKIYMNSTNSNLLQFELVVSWEERDGRIMGEDLDLDGVLDGGEDVNGNGKLDSPATIMSYFAKRE